jgi:NB-ARC domain
MVDPGTSNIMGGYVAGPAVQAGAIHGGVHVYQAAAPRLPVPRQLPPPAQLVGRERELAEIDRIVRRPPAGPAIVVLSGAGGVGKSALALAWAHMAGVRYPDGQLHARLGAGDRAGPADPGSLLAQMLRALGVAAELVPAGTAERGALFRSLTAGKRLLMLLDDATSAAQVRLLRPASPSTVVLVTTRWGLDGLHGDGAAFLAVEPLGDDAATALLVAAIGHERVASDPASTSALVRLCAGLPVALAMAGARLATQPRWPVGRIVEQIAHELDLLPRLGVPEKEVPSERAIALAIRGLADGGQQGVDPRSAVRSDASITMTAINSTNVYQAAGDQYFLE